ncbi:HlyD family type I secretion periplasmic adaptor subunit [Aureimonas psammosilenae]|uniref:HlyD family type I secretion periplasmic adaptor subunit n=1 Tax=Aureimonas psammosilenae TaxID=2495496 RepID=UPI001260E42F|nr:HlyD family type I secretion periplasmic adaptor subunit [Aureimonas psammosilenae]
MSVVAFKKPSELAEVKNDALSTVVPPIPVARVESPDDFNASIRRPIVLGTAIVAIFVVGLGALMAIAPLASAVVASAVVKVEDNRKVVKHRDGGIISKVLVRDGQTVNAGDTLVKMDDVQARSAFDVYDNQYMNLIAQRARFMAEGAGIEQIAFPPALETRIGEQSVAALITDQTALFQKRRQALDNQADILNQRIAQLDTRISGYQAQIDSISQQKDLFDKELKGTKSLASQGYASQTRVHELERASTELLGKRGALQAQIAESEQAKGEARLQINRLYEDRLAESSEGMSKIQGDLANILPRLQAAKATLDLTTVRAPASGRVFGLTQYTDGGVVAPGERILEIVPEGSPMIVEASVNPKDIAELKAGMRAEVKLTAYNQRTTPSVIGEVTKISADRITTENGAAYYVADVRIDPASLSHAAQELRLYPGMPAEVIIPTSERTALDYLISPVIHSMDRAFREE